MEDVQLLLALLLTSILFFCILNANRSSSSSPPGPWKLPAVGSIHHLVSLLPLQRRLAYLAGKYGSEGVLSLQIGQLPVVVVSSPDAAKEVLTGAGFVDRFETLAIQIFSYNHTNLVFSPHGPHWSRIRRICDAELLRPERVRTFHRIRMTESARLVKSISESAGEVIDISEKIFNQLISITFAAAFGDGEQSRKIVGEFVEVIKIASSMSGGLDVCDLFPVWPLRASWKRCTAQRAHQRLDKMLDEIIGGRREPGEDDDGGGLSLIDVLMRGRVNFRLTKHQIKPVILDVFMAGTETSATTIEWAMYELMRNPEIMQRAQSEVHELVKRRSRSKVEEDDIDNLPFLDSIIKETLRLHPPTPLIPRQASKDTNIFGRYEIPCKTRVLVNIWAMGRDPRNWEDAEKFNPDRFGGVGVDYSGKSNKAYTFVPFGGGVRVCPGIGFGKANIVLTLAHLLFHFDWKLPHGMNPGELDMDEGNGAIGFRKNHLCLIATKYNI